MKKITGCIVIVLFSLGTAPYAYAKLNLTVTIKGVDTQLTDNIRAYLSMERQKNDDLLSPGRLQRLFVKSTKEIKQALQPFGFYQPSVQKSLTQTEPGNWLAQFTIDRGKPIPVQLLDYKLTGEFDNNSVFYTFQQKPPFLVGDPFNHLNYDNFKSELARQAAEQGYFDAKFIEHRIEIDLKKYEVRIKLHFAMGKRFAFGEIKTNQTILTSDLLQRYIPFEPGTPYSLNLLLQLQQALSDSDYFDSVEVSPQIASTNDNHVPISIILKPRKDRRYTLGLGYGTDTGARTKLGWEVPRVNNKGHRFNAEARLSEIGYSISTRYQVPSFNPRTDQVIYSAGVVNEKTDTNTSTIRSIGASLNRNNDAWREILSLNYQKEDFIIASTHGNSSLLIPGVSWRRIWGRTFINTLDGLRFDISFRGANDKIASTTSFFQAEGGIKTITPLGQTNRFILRGKVGSTWSSSFEELPSSLRFFAGGTQSVRGYRYQSLGPVDATGDVIGGRYLMSGSVELEHFMNDQWGIAAFYDAGNAYNHVDDKLERGAGLGFRWRSPIGPVRFDYANAISQPDKPWRIHINIGPDL